MPYNHLSSEEERVIVNKGTEMFYRRGRRCFRLSCRLDDAAPMKRDTPPSTLPLHPNRRAAILNLSLSLFSPDLLDDASVHHGHVPIDTNFHVGDDLIQNNKGRHR